MHACSFYLFFKVFFFSLKLSVLKSFLESNQILRLDLHNKWSKSLNFLLSISSSNSLGAKSADEQDQWKTADLFWQFTVSFSYCHVKITGQMFLLSISQIFFSISAIGNGTDGSQESQCLPIYSPKHCRIRPLASCYSKLCHMLLGSLLEYVIKTLASSQTMKLDITFLLLF